MTECGIRGPILSAPGSSLTRAISADASRTYLLKGSILPAILAQFLHQVAAFGDIAADQFLGLPDGLVEPRNLDAVLGPAEQDLPAVLDAKLLAQLGRQNDAARLGYLSPDYMIHKPLPAVNAIYHH